ISALCMDSQSLLWVGTIGDGINVYNTNNQTVHNYPYNIDDPDGISSHRINCITVDKDNNIWIGTQNGLNLFSDKINRFKHFYHEQGNPESLSNNHIICLIIDREGNLWIGTKDGSINKLIKKDNSFLFKRYNINTEEGSLSNNSILSLCTDKKNNLWIGTENGGLYQMNIITNNLKVFRVKEGYLFSLNSNSIWSLYNDYEGRLWIGTYNKGINVIDNEFNKFESYQKNTFDKNSLPDNDVKGFTEDKNGNIWIAMDGGGICRFDPNSHQFDRFITNSDQYKILANNAIQNILYDSNNDLWVGTWGGGIDRFDMNGMKIKNYKVECEDGGGNNNVFEMYEDLEGNIWVGTAGSGLYKYSAIDDIFNLIICENQSGILSKDTYVTAILEDSERCFWVGTLYGMVILKRTSNQKYTCINLSQGDYPSLSSNMINVIFEDSKKRLWFGTGDNGLNLFNRQDSTFTVFQNKDGLPSNSIRGILEDDDGFLWIMTNKGLSKFNYDSLSFRNYTCEDGLNSNEFYRRSCLGAKNGEFYLGGENGFNVFYPKNITNNKFIPPVYLSNLKINNIQAEIGAKDSPLKKHIGETTEITLNHKQSSFTIEFVALNYTRPAKNQFSYKLEGFDPDPDNYRDGWNYVGTRRLATYTNIKPGKYVFMVKGSNNDGVWNNHPTKLKITIKPPVWRSWWAIIIYIILLSVLTIISFKIWNERIKIKNQLKLEQLAREKEHELNELNIKFFTNIAHEFRTPLSLIIAPLESLINSTRDNIKEKLMVIYRNAERLLQLTNNLMDIRKLEDGNTKLKVKNRDLLSFIKDVSSFFYMNSKSHNIDFKIESAENSIPGWFDPEKLETILLNLLSNAFKFTSDNGKITVTANVFSASEIEKKYDKHIEKTNTDSKYIEIKVSDNGTGILPEELPYIFDKFYQAKSSGIKKKSGTGIGLTLTKSLINMHHGNIWVESIPEKETCFVFILPIDPNAYREDEFESKSKDVLKSEIINNPDQTPALQVNMEELPEIESNKEKPEILIVEDNDELRIFIANELGKKYKVAQAENGMTGIDIALSEIPDLIVSDVLMPECSGIDLCKTIKSDVRTSHIPVILLTAKTTINEQIEGIETGADAYITKPFNVQLLLAKIKQLIQSRRKLYAHFSQDVYIMPNKMTENGMDQLFIQKAIDYIILNISDKELNVEGLADAMNMSRSNVYRKIKALTGNTIIEFIRIIRLKQAIKLMETKKYTLAEIAYQTGFTSPAYFTKSFKDQYGKPPSEYLTE
ncbi:MAG: response regulator, partial [Bacteroidales bacterium]|nr:response regulator [Bacteroidales bacterium]